MGLSIASYMGTCDRCQRTEGATANIEHAAERNLIEAGWSKVRFEKRHNAGDAPMVLAWLLCPRCTTGIWQYASALKDDDDEGAGA